MDQNTQFGQYTLVRKIASGGMAEIYLARTGGIRGFEKNLVLKMIHPKWNQDDNFITMLIEEAKLAVQLNHANIAQVFDLGRNDEMYYIAMEYVDGKDLFQILVRTSERDTYVPFDVAAFVTEQTAAALHYAHTRTDAHGNGLNLIHRDISPQNILVSLNGEIKLVDFGIAKAAVRPGNTQIGIIKGKFYYMSPEQAWGKPLDHRSDIFSLGICLHEMLTGQMLYAEDDQLFLLEKVRAADIPLPSSMRSGIPRELEAITMRALAANPDRRFQTAFDFQRALTEYLHRNAAGFTPTRAARMMFDLFPESAQTPMGPESTMDQRDFAQHRPPESVIFDLKTTGRPGPTTPSPSPKPNSPSGSVQPVGRREATKPVKAMPSRNGDDDIFTGDGLGADYPVSKPAGPSGSHHPPPPLADLAEDEGEHTQIANWDAIKNNPAGKNAPGPPSASPGLRPMKGPASSPASDGATAMFNPTDMAHPPRQQPSAAGLRARPGAPQPPQPMPAAPRSELAADERTMMFNPNDMGPPPGIAGPPSTPILPTRPAPAPPRPMPAPPLDGLAADERTMMFNPNDMGSPPPPLAPTKPASPPSGLRAAPAAAAKPIVGEEKTSLFDPSMMPPPVAAPKPPAQDPPTVKADKPTSREDKIAAAKVRAKAQQSDLKDKIDGGEPADAKDLSREEKIAAAKAKAQGGGDLKDRIKKKDDGEGMSREEKIAAAKAKAQGGGDLKDRIAKKPGAAPSGGDDDKLAAAKAKARERSGGPNVVGASKGNADNRARIAGKKDKILGVDANSGFGKVLRVATSPITLGLLFFVFVGGCIGTYAIVSHLTAPPPLVYGTIQIESVPIGAELEFDGIALDGRTPYTIDDVDPETIHSVRLKLENYEPQTRNNIKIVPGEKHEIRVVLEPSPGSLVISSEPSAAQVFIDDKLKGVTPCDVSGLPRVDGAFLNITIQKEGFAPHPATLKWKAGQLKLTYHAQLEPAEE